MAIVGTVERGAAKGADPLRRFLDVMEVALTDPDISGSDLAARAYLSRCYFDRLVSTSFGKHLVRYAGVSYSNVRLICC